MFARYLDALRDELAVEQRRLSCFALTGILMLTGWGAALLCDRLAIKQVDPPTTTDPEARWHQRDEPSVVQPEPRQWHCTIDEFTEGDD